MRSRDYSWRSEALERSHNCICGRRTYVGIVLRLPLPGHVFPRNLARLVKPDRATAATCVRVCTPLHDQVSCRRGRNSTSARLKPDRIRALVCRCVAAKGRRHRETMALFRNLRRERRRSLTAERGWCAAHESRKVGSPSIARCDKLSVGPRFGEIGVETRERGLSGGAGLLEHIKSTSSLLHEAIR